MKQREKLDQRSWDYSLYIPHGSDETLNWCYRNCLLVLSLYPTRFRWNISPNYVSKALEKPLYPTRFRWNREAVCIILFFYISLYPTRFRWNPISEVSRLSPAMLYIPHGSDETSVTGKKRRNGGYFISHTVQMKPFVISALILPIVTLYPTRFRWNVCLIFFVALNKHLYIPHGSDETRNHYY